jgi:Zn-dependent protease
MPIFSAETWVILVILGLGLIWSLLPRQSYRIVRHARVSADDLWNVCHFKRDTPHYSSMIKSVEWDEDGSDNGYFTVGHIRLRFQQRLNAEQKQVSTISVPVDANNQPNGDLYETTVLVTPTHHGARYELLHRFQNQRRPSLGTFVSRFFRPLSVLNATPMMNDVLKNSGAFERFEAIHGPAPVAPSFLGMPLTFMSGLLAIGAFLWFVWIDSFWEGVALMACLLFHELGHVIAMRKLGDKESRFYFIPIFGGVALGQQKLSADWKLVTIVLAGPAAGLASVLAAIALYLLTGSDWFLACASLFALINAANLVPIPILDGGQIFTAFLRPFVSAPTSRWIAIGLLSIAVVGGLFIKSALIVVLFALFIVLQLMNGHPEYSKDQRALSPTEFVISTVCTVAVATALVWLFLYAEGILEGGMKSNLSAGPFID